MAAINLTQAIVGGANSSRYTSITATTLTVTAIQTQEEAYLYLDYGAAAFDTAAMLNVWSMDFTINFGSFTGTATIATAIAFSSSVIGANTEIKVAGNDGLYMGCNNPSSTTSYNVYLYDINNGATTFTTGVTGLTAGANYYCTADIIPGGTFGVFRTRIWSNATRTTLVGTTTVNLTKQHIWRYLFPHASTHSGASTSPYTAILRDFAILGMPNVVISTAAGTGVATASATATQITPATASGAGVATAAAIPIAYTTTSATAAGAGVATANAVPIGTTTISASATGAGVATANAVPIGTTTISAAATGAGVATGSAVRTATSTIVSSANGAGVATATAAAASPPGQATATATAVATGSAIGLSRNSKPATAAGVATGSAINTTATTAQYKIIRWRVLSRNQTTGLLQPVTGLTPTLKIVRDADSLCHDFADRAFKPAPQCTTLNATMTPTDQTNMPGLYGYSWRIDGYGTTTNEAYAILAQASDAADNYMADDLIVIRNGAAQFGGLTPQESTRLYTDSPDPAAIVAALQATTIPANILEIRGQVLNGSGLSTDPWRPL